MAGDGRNEIPKVKFRTCGTAVKRSEVKDPSKGTRGCNREFGNEVAAKTTQIGKYYYYTQKTLKFPSYEQQFRGCSKLQLKYQDLQVLELGLLQGFELPQKVLEHSQLNLQLGK